MSIIYFWKAIKVLNTLQSPYNKVSLQQTSPHNEIFNRDVKNTQNIVHIAKLLSPCNESF